MTFRIRGSPDRLLELDSGQVARHGRQVIRMAASLALEHGDVQVGMRLRDRSMVSLRGAFEAHERQREVDHGAIELTGRSHEFGLNMRQRVPEHRDWRHVMHLWTERQNREFRDGGEPFGDASHDKAARGGR